MSRPRWRAGAAALVLGATTVVLWLAGVRTLEWWRSGEADAGLALAPIPLDRFDPRPVALHGAAPVGDRPALLGASGCSQRQPPCRPRPTIWVPDGARWVGHVLDLPAETDWTGAPTVTQTGGRLFAVALGHHTADFEPVPLLWHGSAVDDLRLVRLPEAFREVVCDPSRQPPMVHDCRPAEPRVGAAVEGGAVLLMQQGRGRGSLAVHRSVDGRWSPGTVPEGLLEPEHSAVVDGRLLVAGRVCADCPGRLAAAAGILSTRDGIAWERPTTFEASRILALVGGDGGAVVALESDGTCALATSSDGRGWRALAGSHPCDERLGERLSVARDGARVVVAAVRPRGLADGGAPPGAQRIVVVDLADGRRTTVVVPVGIRIEHVVAEGGQTVLVGWIEAAGQPAVFHLAPPGGVPADG